MSYITEINAGIGELDKWQRVTLACMCAASVSPIATRFAQPITRQVFEQGLGTVWKSACDKAADSRVMSIRATIDDLPEATCDDSNVPSYAAMVALGVLTYSLDAIIKNESASQARDACSLATDCYGGYDYVLTFGNTPKKIDPRNPPPPGRLASLQIQSQFRLIKVARSIDLPDLIKESQTLAHQLSSEMESVLPMFEKKRGWDRS